MTRRDWLLSTLAFAPVAYPAAAPSSASVGDAVVVEAGPRRVLKGDIRVQRDHAGSDRDLKQETSPSRVRSDATVPAGVRSDGTGLLREDKGSPRVLFERGASRTAGLPGSTLK